MPACEEDVVNIKLDILKEQLGRLDTNLMSNTNSVEGHPSKDQGQNKIRIKRANDMLITDQTISKLPTKTIDNKESYKLNKYADNKKKNLEKADLEKNKIQIILNGISKMEPQFFKDILNYLKQRFDSKDLTQLGHSSDNEVMDSLNEIMREEANNGSENVSSEEEITYVKEAFATENTSIIDVHNKNSVSFKSLDFGEKELDLEAVDKDGKTSKTLSGTKIQQVNGLLQFSNSSDNIVLEFLLKDHIDMMEREKMDTGNEKSDKIKPKDVTESDDTEESESHDTEESESDATEESESHDTEESESYYTEVSESHHTEKESESYYIEESESHDTEESESHDTEKESESNDTEESENQFQKMGFTECLDIDSSMLYSESLPKISYSSFSTPNASCFLSSVAESVLMKNYSLIPIYSMESFMSRVENRLSLELLVPRNVCFHCNIITSKQTNMPSISVLDDMAFSQTDMKHSLAEDTILHVEKKACNLGSFGLNVCNISLSKKYDSKDVIAMISMCDRDFIDPELEPSCQKMWNSSIEPYEMTSLIIDCDSGDRADVDSNFEELKDLEHIYDSKGLQGEEIEDNSEEMTLLSALIMVDCDYPEENKTKFICEGIRNVGDSFGKNHDMEAEIEKYCRDLGESDYSKGSMQKEAEKTFGGIKDHNKVMHENAEYTFGGLKDLENTNGYSDIYRDKMETSIGKIKYPEKRSGYKDFQEEEVKYTCGELRNQEFMQNKELKQCIKKCENDDLERQSHSQNWFSFGDKRGILDHGWSKGEDDDLTRLDLNQDTEQSLQDNCRRHNWMHGFSHNFSSLNTPKSAGGHVRRGRCSKKKSKKDMKMFVEKFGPNKCKDSFFQKKINTNGRSKKPKQRKHAKFKCDKQASDTSFSGRNKQCYPKNDVSMKKHLSNHFKNWKGNSFHLDRDPPVRLHLVKAKVCSRSGGESGNGGSDRRSTSGMQGDGNTQSDRGAGSGRQSSNGSGSSGGDGNQNNNNNNSNNNLNKSSSSQNGKNKSKNSKPKRGAENNSGNNLPETTSPSLPTPHLDPEHIAERLNVEKARRFHGSNSLTMAPSASAHDSTEKEGSEASPDSGSALNLLPDNDEVPDIQHSAVYIHQLCDTIGDATHGLPSNSETFKSINLCLTHLVHDLSLAAEEDNNRVPFNNCSVCLILSQMLIHQADPSHDVFLRSCSQCTQIFNLTMQHCIGCIQNNRPKTRHTQADLCYKICKYLQWDVGQLNLSVNKLKGKVLKYCDKVLGSTADVVPLRYVLDDPTQAIGEIGIAALPDIPSTGLSSSTTLSLGGNIVTTETGDQEQQQILHEEAQTFVNPAASSVITSVIAGIPPSSVQTVSSGSDPPCHMRLTRKASQRKTPAIPPPIVEESQPLDQGATASASADDGKEHDIENIIYRRWGSKVDDPYETQKTYGERHQYGSLPVGFVHDVEQFYSESTRPLGVPGIGEVVYGHPSQLNIVARFWDKKREECERTRMCPYQHREEGVILADQKENFGILHTRYQKHHQWERVTHLGNGMSGKCHLAIDLKTDFKFCCKKIHLLKYTEEELSLWSEMHNVYVVRLYGAIRHGVKIYIFSEFIDGGSLAACIEEQKRLGRRLSHWSAINYFQQLLKVLAFLQKKNILHEDIKADNILLRRNSTYLAVTDFGTSRRLQDPKELKNKSPVGSPTHWSPEKATMEGHGFPSDLWAAVCVLVHMLSGEPPWLKRFQTAAILNFIIYTRSPPMEDIPDNVQLVVRDLIERGFVKDPQARPSSSELLQHPAFSILDEGRPETYFSTLASMAHSGVHAIRMASAGVSEPRNANMEEPPTNILNSVSAGATVLFETNVNRGPYQESDSRPDHMNHQSYIGLLRASNHNDQDKAASVNQSEVSCAETNDSHREVVESSDVKYSGQTSGCVNENATIAPSPLATVDEEAVLPSKMDSKVNPLVEPFDINKLLPQFDDLFVSGDSQNTQSIKDFFTDNYRTRDLSDARQSNLQVYKPEERTEELPNLSIFNDICEVTGQQNDGASIPVQERKRFPIYPSPSHNTMNFMLSSGSDDCTSADLFDFDPAARNSGTAQNASNSLDTQAARNEASDSPKQSVYPPGDVSPTVSTGSNTSSPSTSNLQQRKPTNLILNIACTSQPSGLSRSQSDIQASSSTSGNGIEQKNRSNTWTQLSGAAQSLYHTGNTPISSHAASAIKKTSTTSIPSTASSGNSQFYLRSSVIEEQERMFQELTSDMNPYSPTSSDSDNLGYVDYPQLEPVNYSEARDYEESQDMQTLRNTMLEEIDESMLVGHNLMFYDETGVNFFTIRIEELPTYWKRLIQMVRHKISFNGYSHFRVYHMDNTPVKFNHPITTCEFKVVSRQDPGSECWCQQCYTMY